MGIGAVIKLALAILLKVFASLWVAVDTAIIVALLVVRTYHINVLFSAVMFHLAITVHKVSTNI